MLSPNCRFLLSGLTRLDQLNDRLPASYNFSDTKLQNSYRELVEKFLKGNCIFSKTKICSLNDSNK